MWVPLLFNAVINIEVVALIPYIILLNGSLSSLTFMKTIIKMTVLCFVCCSENVTFKRVCSFTFLLILYSI